MISRQLSLSVVAARVVINSRPTNSPREEEPTMIDPTTELRVRQEIADRVARASRRRLEARVKSGRKSRRGGLDSL